MSKKSAKLPEWVKLITAAAPDVLPVSAFEDFVSMLFLLSQGKPDEARALPSINGDEKRVDAFLQAAVLLGEEMAEHRFEDLLGAAHQEMRGLYSQQGTGSFYTPTCLCQVMAAMTDGGLADAHAAAAARIAERGIFRVLDPAVGAGRTLLSFAEVHRDNLPFLRFYGTDIEINACRMSYVNMMLNGMAAEIRHGNDLTGEVWAVWRTPEWYTYEQMCAEMREAEERWRRVFAFFDRPAELAAPAAAPVQMEFDFTFSTQPTDHDR